MFNIQQLFFKGSLFTGGRNSYLLRPLPFKKRNGSTEKLVEGGKKSGCVTIKHGNLLYLPHRSKGEPITKQPKPALQPEQSRLKKNSSSFTTYTQSHSTRPRWKFTHCNKKKKNFRVERFKKDAVVVERLSQHYLYPRTAAVIIKERCWP